MSATDNDQGNTKEQPNNDSEVAVTKSNTNNSFAEKVEGLVSLVMDRCTGKSNNDAIEEAVSALIQNHTPSLDKIITDVEVADCIIEEDGDDYDDVDEKKGDEGDEEEDYKPALATRKSPRRNVAEKESKRTTPQAASATKSGKRRKIASSASNEATLESIPFGKQGAKMMVTFGDGHDPNPETVSTALLGVRKYLQNTIKDARALRRKLQIEYARAKIAMNPATAKTANGEVLAQSGCRELDPDMCFRILKGYDKMRLNPSCGFDISQLEQLFPEEMKEYQRWQKMHKEYMKSKNSDETKAQTEDNKDDNDEETSPEEEKDDNTGHLRSRMAQFDIRTSKMKYQWYMNFTELRSGSFLRQSKQTDKRQWNENRKQITGRGRGRTRNLTWEMLPASSVQFLHWLGFEPKSALPPPDDRTTQALGYLGYDFMGRIVERAIYLRYLARRKAASAHEIDDIILELEEGEQLEVQDIERALHDEPMNTGPLYAPQLYFGPGFENRLELELSHITGKNSDDYQPDEEEMKIRRQDDDLFAKIAAPPKLLEGVFDVLTATEDEYKTDNDVE